MERKREKKKEKMLRFKKKFTTLQNEVIVVMKIAINTTKKGILINLEGTDGKNNTKKFN